MTDEEKKEFNSQVSEHNRRELRKLLETNPPAAHALMAAGLKHIAQHIREAHGCGPSADFLDDLAAVLDSGRPVVVQNVGGSSTAVSVDVNQTQDTGVAVPDNVPIILGKKNEA